jgi:hypothetical protein
MGPTLWVCPGGSGAIVRIEGEFGCLRGGSGAATPAALRHAELHGWSMHQKMITLTGMEGVLPIRDQDGDSGTCASGEPEHLEY